MQTDLLRRSDEPFWRRLRELILEKGEDPESSTLAVSWPEDADLQLGYLVTSEGRIFQFEFREGHRRDFHPRSGFTVSSEGEASPKDFTPRPASTGEDAWGLLEEWRDVTTDRTLRESFPEIGEALEM